MSEHRAKRSVHVRGLEPVAAADGRDHQVQRGMFRVSTFVQHCFGRAVIHADLDEFLRLRVMFAEVLTETALTVVYLQHDELLSERVNSILSVRYHTSH